MNNIRKVILIQRFTIRVRSSRTREIYFSIVNMRRPSLSNAISHCMQPSGGTEAAKWMVVKECLWCLGTNACFQRDTLLSSQEVKSEIMRTSRYNASILANGIVDNGTSTAGT